MGGEIKMRGWRMVAAILLSSLAGIPTLGVLIPYEFVGDESILTVYGSRSFPYFVEGHFELVYDLDTGAAFLQQVNATFDREVSYYSYPDLGWLYTDNLDVLFQLTELEAVYVSETQIDFLLEKNIPRFPGADVHLTLAFLEDSVEMTGYFCAPVVDCGCYSLHAVALVVPEPSSILLVSGGVLFVKKRTFRARL